MPVYFFRSEPGAAELRRLARSESGRVCQRVVMIANMLEGMEHEEAARLAGLSRSAAYGRPLLVRRPGLPFSAPPQGTRFVARIDLHFYSSTYS